MPATKNGSEFLPKPGPYSLKFCNGTPMVFDAQQEMVCIVADDHFAEASGRLLASSHKLLDLVEDLLNPDNTATECSMLTNELAAVVAFIRGKELTTPRRC